MPVFEPLLLGVGLAHGLVGVLCLGLLRLDATPILGVHPAWKPLKFAMSIALFLVSMALVRALRRRRSSAAAAVTQTF